jgi:hypothetical protein
MLCRKQKKVYVLVFPFQCWSQFLSVFMSVLMEIWQMAEQTKLIYYKYLFVCHFPHQPVSIMKVAALSFHLCIS